MNRDKRVDEPWNLSKKDRDGTDLRKPSLQLEVCWLTSSGLACLYSRHSNSVSDMLLAKSLIQAK